MKKVKKSKKITKEKISGTIEVKENKLISFFKNIFKKK